MGGMLSMLYGGAAYLLFLAAFLYAIAFTGNLPVPHTIDQVSENNGGALLPSLAIDLGLLTLFAVQHSVMARPGFKRWWTQIVPQPVERATFVLAASLVLILLYWQWRPLPALVWQVTDPIGATALTALFWTGWGTVFFSTFLISHAELFGLAQVWARLTGRAVPGTAFRTPGLYRLVRHPIYLGFLLAFWATPAMSLGHLVFAIATTGYILVGIQLEERDLIRLFGARYRRYREEVAMLIPWRLIPWRLIPWPRRSADWPPLALRRPKREV